jgi:hypothetical protein
VGPTTAHMPLHHTRSAAAVARSRCLLRAPAPGMQAAPETGRIPTSRRHGTRILLGVVAARTRTAYRRHARAVLHAMGSPVPELRALAPRQGLQRWSRRIEQLDAKQRQGGAGCASSGDSGV